MRNLLYIFLIALFVAACGDTPPGDAHSMPDVDAGEDAWSSDVDRNDSDSDVEDAGLLPDEDVHDVTEDASDGEEDVDDDDLTCELGYVRVGDNCVDVDECAANTHDCPENTVCVPSEGWYTCECAEGYEESEEGCVDMDECSDADLNDCDENASCTNIEGSYTCECNAGYEGDGASCDDVDECALGTHTCDAHATCTNTDGGYDCACDDGYEGDGFSCTDVNECALGTHTCDENAACMNTDGGFDCSCDTGYEGNGFSCTDVDECAQGTDTCDSNASCTNTEGSYTCECNEGYEGNGFSCADVDECTLGTHTCDSNASCTNTDGGFTCECNEGYDGDGFSCADVDECADGTATCDGNASCTNTEGSYDCSCDTGYEGDGFSCTDVDECVNDNLNNCNENASCTNTAGGFICECNTGYEGDGTSCSEVCGDGIVTENEECDDGQYNGDVCVPGYDQSCSYCGTNCQEVTVDGPHCGDGVLDTGEGEECEAGVNAQNGGCDTSTCKALQNDPGLGTNEFWTCFEDECCIGYTGDITINHSRIITAQYPLSKSAQLLERYCKVTGDVTVDAETHGIDLTNIDVILREVEGDFILEGIQERRYYDFDDVGKNLDSFNKLEKVGGTLRIRGPISDDYGPYLVGWDGLTSLKEIGGDLILGFHKKVDENNDFDCNNYTFSTIPPPSLVTITGLISVGRSNVKTSDVQQDLCGKFPNSYCYIAYAFCDPNP